MIDIHNHLLYDIDDGPKTKEDTIEIIKSAQEYEIYKIVATPHYREGSYKVKGKKVKDKVNEINKIIKKKDLRVEIFPGNEIYITKNLVEKKRRYFKYK